MTVIANPPYPSYFDVDGSPLEDGYIYFGAANQNPETNPITVYWDAAYTQPALQPIRTSGGFTYRAGTPANIYVSTDFSITVRDKNRRLVYSKLLSEGQTTAEVNLQYSTQSITATTGQTVFGLSTSYTPGNNSLAVYHNGSRLIVGSDYTETSATVITLVIGTTAGDVLQFVTATPVNPSSLGAAAVAYIPAGAGAVATNVQAKLRETVSVRDFGAVGDGVADDTAAFNAAPDNSLVPAGTYRLTASIAGKTFFSLGDVTLTGAGSANVVNVVEDFIGGFTAVDSGTYPSTALEYKSEPSLVATTSGKVFAFYRIGPGHQGTVGDTGYLVYRVYDKLTNSWGATQTLVARNGFDSRNQIAGVTPTGRIFVAYYQCEYTAPGVINELTRGTKYRYSDNDGITWSSEFNLSQYCAYPSLDNVPFGKLISFANGNLLISIYNYHTIITLKSTDNGATWGTTSGSLPNPNANLTTVYTTPVLSDDNITEPTLVKIDDSNLVCLGRSIPTGQVIDGTVTWTFLGIRRTNTTAYQVDQYINTTALRIYRCTVAGTSGSTEPTHTSGTAVDGSVTWQYIGTATNWAATTAYSAGTYVITYSNYAYQCATAGTSGSTASFYAKVGGNELQIAYFKSTDGGTTWSAASYITWTPNTWKVTTSPPTAIVRGDTVDIAWFSRSPEWSLYRVRMSARAFFENPSWAFSNPDGEPRSRVMRSYIAPTANSYGWRVDVGYVSISYLPWTEKLMASWYDKAPAQLGIVGKTTLYSTIIEP